MAKFRQLDCCLRETGLASDVQMHRPLPVPRRLLELVHHRVRAEWRVAQGSNVVGRHAEERYATD